MKIDKKKLLLKDLPTIRQMLAFISVYELSHMSAAAEELSLTQPAVTVLIKELESTLGVKLFDRATRTLKPSEAAHLVHPYIVRSLRELSDMNARLKQLQYLELGHLSIGITPSTSHSLLPILLEDFRQHYPHIQLNIVECEPLEIVPALLKEKVDIAIGSLQQPIAGIQKDKIFEDELVAVAHHAYFDREDTMPKTWQDVIQHPLLLTKIGYGIRHQIDQVFKSHQIDQELNIAQEATLISTVIALAQSRLGIAIVPRSTVYAPHPVLKAQILQDPVLSREISMLYLKDKALTPSAAALLTRAQLIDWETVLS